MKKRLIALAIILLALVACENPVDHFTEGPDRGKKIVIDCGELDLSDDAPPAVYHVTDTTCTKEPQ